MELHFDELPSAELETILHQRCSLPPSYCTKLVKVMQDLQVSVHSSVLLNTGQIVVTLSTLGLFSSFFNLLINLRLLVQALYLSKYVSICYIVTLQQSCMHVRYKRKKQYRAFNRTNLFI